MAKSLFFKTLPQEKFPYGTKARDLKAQMIAERVFRCLVYCTTSIAIFWSLKRSNFLHRHLTGTEDYPDFFQNYPC